MIFQLRNGEVYDCKNTETLPGTLVLQENSIIKEDTDEACTEAFVFSGIVHDFYHYILGRNSLDDKGMLLKSSCHYGKAYNNAFWNGTQMAYGDGDGKLFLSFTKSLDVIGHELTHGMVQNTAELVYWFESGALNEHFADVFGESIKQWLNGDTPETADWLIGPEIIGPEFEAKYKGKAIRSFKNEKAYSGDSQPKHYSKKYKGLQDNGGVHINSGIPNHAYYLVCLELGKSYDKPIKIWYNTLLRLKAHDNFKKMATICVEEAKELYGDEVAAIVKKAWIKVGVLK